MLRSFSLAADVIDRDTKKLVKTFTRHEVQHHGPISGMAG